VKVSLIFDLDGTLVDSTNGILASLEAVFNSYGLRPAVPLSSSLIGPPLHETLCLLCPNYNEATLEQLASSFKTHYDTLGFQQTIPFPGVDKMLNALAAANVHLNIATNKRNRPTLQILEALCWSGLFDQVLSPDSYSPQLPNKASILEQLLTEVNLVATDCLYIGDRLDDYKAAKAIGIPFALAAWGFEGDDAVFHSHTIRLETPNADQVMNILNVRASR
jgi:phosphoglycolate phosphatase